MTKSTTELKPCPFCGGEPILHEHAPHSHSLMWGGKPIMPDYPGSWTIECCDVGMIKDTREEVVAAWNRRSAAHGEQSKEFDSNVQKVNIGQACSAEQSELPPLPEPLHDYMTRPGFTENQMREYARAALASAPAKEVPEGGAI